MRTILIVLDSVGIGELPDAAEFLDEGSNTLINIKKAVPEMNLPNMNRIGLSSIDGAELLADEKVENTSGSYGKMLEVSKGKDTTIGHWEIAGVIVEKPMPTYPNGFPKELIEEFEKRIGIESIGNYASSGTAILDELGEEHVKTGKVIVYTSADSVFQVAAHEDVVPVDELYRICQIARDMLVGEHAMSRVIARPFLGSAGNYTRTRNRKDFSLEPPSKTMLDCIKDANKNVWAVGKIEDIFAGCGITDTVHIEGNMDGVDKTLEYMDREGEGLIFVNLVDFDMLFGHRNDSKGYAEALMEFDKRIPEIQAKMKNDDILLITADHGCDPTTESTDHSREYIPILAYGTNIASKNLHIRDTFADISATVLEYLQIPSELKGTSFLKEILKDA